MASRQYRGESPSPGQVQPQRQVRPGGLCVRHVQDHDGPASTRGEIGENQLPACTLVQKTLHKDKFNPDGTYALAVSSYVIFKIKKVMFKAGKKIYSSGARKRTWAEMNESKEDEDVGGRVLPKIVSISPLIHT